MTKFLNINIDNTLGGETPSNVTVSSQKAVKEYIDSESDRAKLAENNLNINKQDTLVSGTNIKTINSQSLLGSGDIEISGAEEDNITITKNASDKIQAVGVINQNDNTTALKEWKGTLAEYNALSEYDDNIKYIITDDYDGGSSVYTKTEVDTLLSNKQDIITYTYDSTNEKMIIA